MIIIKRLKRINYNVNVLLAQSEERMPSKHEVEGSNPS
jgi:hypothetical protein